MTELFWTLADAAFAAGWVVMSLCLFRLLCKKYLPRWLAVAMWLLVAVRLVCPFSIESEMSLMPEPLSQTVNTYWVQTDSPITPGETPSVEPDAPTTEPIVTDPTPDTPAVSWETIACCVWLVGMVAMLGYMAVSYGLLRNSVRTATKREHNICECETVDTPFILGVIRPRIYLPYDMSDADRESALAHERAHIARGDHIWKFAAFLLLSVYWFNPLLWLAYYLLCRDIEFACDEKVIKDLSQDGRKTYSHALLSAAVTQHRAVLCPLAFGEVGVEARVTRVMKYKKPLRTLVVIALIGCTIVAWRLVTDPPAPSKTTLENAHVHVQLEGEMILETNSLLVEKGNRVSLHTEDGKPLQLVIEEIDTEDMTVTVSFSQKVYRDGKEGRRIAVGLNEQEVLSTAKNGGSELSLGLVLPTAAEVDEDTRETVYFGDGTTLRLYEQYYRLQFDDEDIADVCGTYEQTADTLTLTQDAHLTQYVLRADGSGGWQFDADASYRHKKASSPVLDDGAAFAFGYRYELELVNQHYTYKVFNVSGDMVLSSYSSYGVKPVFTMDEKPWLEISVYAPAANPRTRLFRVNVETGEMPTMHGGMW